MGTSRAIAIAFLALACTATPRTSELVPAATERATATSGGSATPATVVSVAPSASISVSTPSLSIAPIATLRASIAPPSVALPVAPPPPTLEPRATLGVPTIGPAPTSQATVAPQVTIAPLATFEPLRYIGQGDRFNCGDFASQAQAQAVLRADPHDPNRLDGDRDGIACEDNRAPKDLVPVPRL